MWLNQSEHIYIIFIMCISLKGKCLTSSVEYEATTEPASGQSKVYM